MLVVPVFQSLVDRQSPLFPIYGIPSQSNQLGSPQSGFQQQQVLPVIVRLPRNFHKLFLLIHCQEFNVINSPNRFGIPHTVHRVLYENVVHHSRPKHRSHCNVGLADRRAGIFEFHPVQDRFAVHGLDIAYAHGTYHRANVDPVSFLIITSGIESQIAD